MISREQRKRDLTRDRMRRLRERRRMGQAPPAPDPPSDPEPGPESVEPEYVPELPPPAPAPPSDARLGAWELPPDFDPYTQPIPGFMGDLEWLRKTRLGLDGPWADLFRLSHEGADRWDPRVVAALALLEEGWRVYGPTFEERTAFGPRGKEQAAIWRWEIERLLTL